MRPAGTAYAFLLTSRMGRGTIASLDRADAAARPGVIDILTF
ncbi:hypothetical protein DLJ53_09060 [Acuticoccus sediminis]|uniref:Uncharacterized protein n=1 Tax=Acuticoccus sediminis TaxID=2184697 RepID=A0A8B2NV19_9HYPH|nr:hypothetical protein DLJ53_09060 [Acuticoccus sediminis]